MSALNRRRVTLIGVSGLSLAVAGVIAPGAFAADTIDGDVKVSNTETVQVLMSADGSIDAQRVYEQVVLTGNGSVDISNPVSDSGLRNLDGFRGFDVRDGKARIKTDVDGTKKFRSVSDFTGKLPLKFDITYTLDGKKIKPADIVGKSGELEVRYVVTNTTGKAQEVPFEDGNGVTKTSTEDVVIPMVGSVTTVLPSSFTKVQSAEANAAGDGRGGTQLSFTMTLIPPIGTATAEFGYKAQVKDAVVPKASVSALPVNPLESPSFKGGAASYAGGAQTGQDLTAGATEIDANLLKIRDGASDLLAGIIQLRDGANKLSAGLSNDAAPGAKKLAAGADKLDAGAKQLAGGTGDLSAGASKLNKGAGDLSDGLKTAKAGGPQLLDGVAKLKAGAQAVDKGLGSLNSLAVPGLGQINGAANGLINGVATKLNPALDGANAYIAGARANVAGSPTMSGGEKTTVNDLLDDAADLVTAVKTGLNDTSAPAGFMYGLGAIKKGSADLGAGIDAQTSGAAAGKDGTLRNGVAQLIGGLTQLEDKGGDLVDGLGKLSAGANQLKAGTGDLKSGANQLNAGAGTLKGGTDQLSDGAGTLADGLGTAASGSGELAAGLEKAAGSAPALPEGAERLSKEGTSQLIAKGDATASDFGLRFALIEAGAARAGSAQPYGSPEGATSLAAFKFEIAGESGADSANLQRGMGAVVLLAAAGTLATVRRRGII